MADDRATPGGPDANLDTLAVTPESAPAGPPVAVDRLPEVRATRYRMADEVGRGGLGRVLRAHDLFLDRTVAIKELHGDDELARRRFVREALVTARLQHPSIVPVYEAGRWPDRSPFYAMKLVAGKPLSDVLEATRSLTERLALVPTVLAVADAIAYAHSERIVHRDLKPHNVLVGGFGETVVIDWGLAKDLSDASGGDDDAGPYRAVTSADATVAGAVMGTPAYMAPEQAAGDPVDERTDVYALGAMLYHVLAGVAPHGGKGMDEVLVRILAGDITPLVARVPEVPPDLAAIVGKAMALAPAARYPTAGELADDLRRFTTGQLVGAHRYTWAQRVRRWIRKHRAVTAVASAAIVVLAVFGTWSIGRILRETDRADRERDTAVTQRDEAIAQANRAVLAQSRAAIERDPAEALAWLKRLDARGPGWQAARVVAAAALSRPRMLHQISDLPGAQLAISPDRATAVVWGNDGMTVVQLATGRTYQLGWSLLGPPIFCDDRRRALSWGGPAVAPSSLELTIELEAGLVETSPGGTELERLERHAACATSQRLITIEERLVGWDVDRQAFVDLPVGRPVLTADPVEGGTLVRTAATLELWGPGGRRGAVPLDANAVVGAGSRDGRLVVTVEPTVAVLDLPTGRRTVLSDRPAAAAAVAPDGSWIAAAQDGAITIFDASSGEVESIADAGRVRRLEASSDGNWLLAVGDSAMVWEIAGRRSVRRVAVVNAVDAMLGDGQVIGIDDDRTLRVYALDRAATFLDDARVAHAAFSKDGRWLVFATERGLYRRSMTGDPRAEQFALAEPYLVALAVSDDGAAILARYDGGLLRWPRDTAPVVVQPPSTEAVEAVAWSRRGVPLSLDRFHLSVWDGGEARQVSRSAEGDSSERDPLGAPGGRIVIGPGALVASTRSTYAPVRLVDLDTMRGESLPGSAGLGAAFSDDGRFLITGALDGGVLRWEVATRTATRIGDGPLRVWAASAPAPDGTIALGGRGTTLLVSPAPGTVEALAGARAPIVTLAWKPDGALVGLEDDATLLIWDRSSGEHREVQLRSALALRVTADRVDAVTADGLRTIVDDLPPGADALRARLAAWPYQLDPAGRLVASDAP